MPVTATAERSSNVAMLLLTVVISALSPGAAYLVLDHIKDARVQSALKDPDIRSLLFLYITVATVYTSSLTTIIGALPHVIRRPRWDFLRVSCTISCAVVGMFFLLFFTGPLQERVSLKRHPDPRSAQPMVLTEAFLQPHLR